MEKSLKQKKKKAKKPTVDEPTRPLKKTKKKVEEGRGPSDAEAPAKIKKAPKRKAGDIDTPDSAEASKTKASWSKKKQKNAGGDSETVPADSKPAGSNSTVFVDGVPYDWSKEQLSEFFRKKCGEVTEVRAPTWQDSGRLRGYAHVVLGSEGSKAKALALNGTKVGKKGRYLKIEPAKEPGEGKSVAGAPGDLEGKRRLFVKNLPYSATEDDIAKLFVKCGKVVEIRIPHQAGRSKGFAYVEFAKAKGLLAAVQLDPAPTLQGRKLLLDADSGSGPKAGFHHRAEAFHSKFGPAKLAGQTAKQ
ncbi:NUCL1, partial [Symbiodinium natans]